MAALTVVSGEFFGEKQQALPFFEAHRCP